MKDKFPRPLFLLGSLALLFLIASFVFAAFTQYSERSTRRYVSKVRSDLRSVATAIESYYVDNMQYPAMSMDRSLAVGAYRLPYDVPVSRTFRYRHDSDLLTLTTPIAYLVSYFDDPFATYRGTPFVYHTDRWGWILGSWGPNRNQRAGGDLQWQRGGERVRYDIDTHSKVESLLKGEEVPTLATYLERPIPIPLPGQGVASVYNVMERQPSELLLTGNHDEYGQGAFTYDPTNGLFSQGDIWRVKQ